LEKEDKKMETSKEENLENMQNTYPIDKTALKYTSLRKNHTKRGSRAREKWR